MDHVEQFFEEFDLGKEIDVAYDQFMAFFSAVGWSEPWIIALCVFHILYFLTILAWRNNASMLTSLFIVTGILTFSAEYLNDYGSRNWRLFAKFNYFDSNGLFLSVMYSTPLLLNQFLIVVLTLRMCAQLLVQVKKAEHAREKRKKK
eukprot:GFYU01002373.1.p1 GENE.GFYU01002373.1~~GFYU01002373.1.p1  ORF type:complete len:147 (-),score=29.62 GFYU01002373.1:210-650(-)